ncbi:uncharacterized protein [Lolium perenne]|uniref:uncharacterized protein isoform X1 n=2 Tax=Lolium perenne TaxID=4522 RepID=UPI0021F67FED|nr:uncharacterized protein LOC127302413 isoform X1 [Lolium perenne]
MSGGGGGGNGAVVHMEEAVNLLVEHLVRPVLPRRAGQDERHMTLEKQRAVAQQVHTAIIMYNYYHRKVSPKLAFADPKRFFTCASLSVGEDLLPYLSIAHARENDSGDDATLSVTDKGAIQACKIAAELDATKIYPDMGVWPIGKVAVLLLDPTKKKCLIEYGADTKGVWSFIEKEYDAASGISHSTNQPAGEESTNKTTFGALDGPLILQQLAMSEVQRRTGMDGSDLLVLDEDLTYSLSKGRTTTKLFIVEYKKTTMGKLVEVSLEDLILSMNGPVFVNDPFLKTTSVVEYYHILPYKEILQGLLHRKWPDVPRHRLNSGIDEKLEEQGENSMSKMKKQTAEVSTPKQNKRAIKATDANSKQNSNISKNKKSFKRKAEASRDTAAEGLDGESPIIENKHKKSCKGKAEASRTTAAQGLDDEIPVIENKHNKSCKRKPEASRITATEGPDGESPITENESLVVPDVKTSGLPTNKSINTKATTVVSGGPILLQSGGQVDKHKTQNDNMPQDVLLPMAPYVDNAIENCSSKHQNMEMTGNSGGITENNNDQMYESLRSLQKIRDEILRKECILQERSIQIDMEIHTILNEGKVTPKALAIVDSYKGTCSNMTAVANSACSGDGGQTRSIKRNKLKQAFLNKCEELDAICKKCEWMLPRYAIVLSVADGMFRATVHLACSEFDMSIVGDPSPTPRKARYSAAANMIAELEKNKEEEDEEEQDS